MDQCENSSKVFIKRLIAKILIVCMLVCSNGMQTLANSDFLFGTNQTSGLEEQKKDYSGSTTYEQTETNKNLEEQNLSGDKEISDEEESDVEKVDSSESDETEAESDGEDESKVVESDGKDESKVVESDESGNVDEETTPTDESLDEDIVPTDNIAKGIVKNLFVCSKCGSENIEFADSQLNILHCNDCDHYFQKRYGANETSIAKQVEENLISYYENNEDAEQYDIVTSTTSSTVEDLDDGDEYMLFGGISTPSDNLGTDEIKEKVYLRNNWFNATKKAKNEITSIEFREIDDIEEYDEKFTLDEEGKINGYLKGTSVIISAGEGNKIYGQGSWKQMFADFSQLKEIDFSNVDTSEVESMQGMFQNCSSLVSINLENFDTSKVETMQDMFKKDSSLKTIKFPEGFAKNATVLHAMFAYCTSLESIDISNFDTSKVVNARQIFYGCTALKTININTEMEKWFTVPDVDTTQLFYNCKSLVGGKGTEYDSNKINGDYARVDYGSFRPGYFTYVSNDSNDSLGDFMLDYGNTNKKVYLRNNWFNTIKKAKNEITSIEFREIDDIEEYDDRFMLSEEDKTVAYLKGTSVIICAGEGNKIYGQGSWKQMFADFSQLKEIDFSNVDTSEVESMQGMFQNCSSLVSINLENFDTSKVETMQDMFKNASSLKTIKLPEGFAKEATVLHAMFAYCTSLESIDISNFDTSKVVNARQIFYGCTKLKTINVNTEMEKWFTVPDVDTTQLFYNCKSLVGGEGTKYDSNKINGDYARVDNGSDRPGYFTYNTMENTTDYHINYDYGYESSDIATYSFVKYNGTDYDNLVIPERVGYKFLGWYEDTDYEDKYTGDDLKEIQDENTIYAKWEEKEYSINYIVDNKVLRYKKFIEKRLFTEEVELPTSYDMKFTGNVFEGWRDKNTNNIITVIEANTDKDFVLEAVWRKVRYTIVYEPNGGTIVGDKQFTKVYGENPMYLQNPNKYGYIFGGWYRDRNFEKEYVGQDLSVVDNDTQTVYAKWIAVSNIIDTRWNGIRRVQNGVLNLQDFKVPNYMYAMNRDKKSITSKYKEKYTLSDLNNDGAKYRYRISGLVYTGRSTEEISIIVFSKGKKAFLSNEEEWSCYVVGVKSTDIKISLGNIGDFNSSNTVISKDDYGIDIFIGSFYENLNNTCKVTFNSEIKCRNFNDLYYQVGAGTTLKRPDMADEIGYRFDGWYVNGVLWDFSNPVYNDIVITAKWKEIEYSINYNLMGGDWKDGFIATTSKLYSESVMLPTSDNVSKEGLTLSHWKDASSEMTIDKIGELNRDVDLIAVYDVATYDIVYTLNDGDWKEGYVVDNKKVHNEEFVLATSSALTKTGYKFVGWTTKDSENIIEKIDADINNTLEVFAIWEPIQYKIRYNFNGGEITTPSYFIKTYGVDYEDLITPTKEGDIFEAWYTYKNGMYESQYIGGDISCIENDVKDIYAKWNNDNEFIISYELFDGKWVEGYIATTSRMINDSVVLPTYHDVVKIGYSFGGWYERGENERIYIIERGVNKSLDLVARWYPNEYTVLYKANGGYMATDSFVKTYGVPVKELDTPIRAGFEFKGWYVDSNLQDSYYGQELSSNDGDNVPIFGGWDGLEGEHYHEILDATFSEVKIASDFNDGNYLYLADNITLTNSIREKLESDLYICLNDHKLIYDCDKPFVGDLNGHNLIITDCSYAEKMERVSFDEEDDEKNTDEGITFRDIQSSGKLIINKEIKTKPFITVNGSSKLLIENITIESSVVMKGLIKAIDGSDLTLNNTDIKGIKNKTNALIDFAGKSLSMENVCLSDNYAFANTGLMKINKGTSNANDLLTKFDNVMIYNNQFEYGSLVDIVDRGNVDIANTFIYASNSIADYTNKKKSTNISIANSKVIVQGKLYGINNRARDGGVFTLDNVEFTNEGTMQFFENGAIEDGGVIYATNNSKLNLESVDSQIIANDNVSMYFGGFIFLENSALDGRNILANGNEAYAGSVIYSNSSNINLYSGVKLKYNLNSIYLKSTTLKLPKNNDEVVEFIYNSGQYLFHIDDETKDKKSIIDLNDCLIDENSVYKLFSQRTTGQNISFGGNTIITGRQFDGSNPQVGISVSDEEKDTYSINSNGLGVRASISFVCYNETQTTIVNNIRETEIKYINVRYDSDNFKLVPPEYPNKKYIIKSKDKVNIRYYENIDGIIEYADDYAEVTEGDTYSLPDLKRQPANTRTHTNILGFVGWSEDKDIGDDYKTVALLGKVLRLNKLYLTNYDKYIQTINNDNMKQVLDAISLEDVKDYISEYITNDTDRLTIATAAITEYKNILKEDVEKYGFKLNGSMYEVKLNDLIKFLGWKSDDSEKVITAEDISKVLNKIYSAGISISGGTKYDKNYYAIWDKKSNVEDKCVIEYRLFRMENGVVGDDELAYAQLYHYGDRVRLYNPENDVYTWNNTFGLEDYTLAGWAYSLYDNYYTEQIITVTESMTLYGVYGKKFKDLSNDKDYVTDIDVGVSKWIKMSDAEKTQKAFGFIMSAMIMAAYTVFTVWSGGALGALSPLLNVPVLWATKYMTEGIDKALKDNGKQTFFESFGAVMELADLVSLVGGFIPYKDRMGTFGKGKFGLSELFGNKGQAVFNQGRWYYAFFSEDFSKMFDKHLGNVERMDKLTKNTMKVISNTTVRYMRQHLTVSDGPLNIQDLKDKNKEKLNSLKQDGYYSMDDFYDAAKEMQGNYDNIMEYYNNYLTEDDDIDAEVGLYIESGLYCPLYSMKGKNKSNGEMKGTVLNYELHNLVSVATSNVVEYFDLIDENKDVKLRFDQNEIAQHELMNPLIWMVDGIVFSSAYSAVFAISDLMDWASSNIHSSSDEKEKKKQARDHLKEVGYINDEIMETNLNDDGDGCYVALGVKKGRNKEDAITDIMFFEIPYTESILNYAYYDGDESEISDIYRETKYFIKDKRDNSVVSDSSFIYDDASNYALSVVKGKYDAEDTRVLFESNKLAKLRLRSDPDWIVIPRDLNKGKDEDDTKDLTSVYIAYKKDEDGTPINDVYLSQLANVYRVKGGVQQTFVMARDLTEGYEKGDGKISHLGNTNYSRKIKYNSSDYVPFKKDKRDALPIRMKVVKGKVFPTIYHKVALYDMHYGPSKLIDITGNEYPTITQDGFTAVRKSDYYVLPKLADDGKYVFEGWTLDPEGKEAQFEPGTRLRMLSESRIYYAVYRNTLEDMITVYKDADDENIEPYGIQYTTVGRQYRLLDAPKKEGYEFLGWAEGKTWLYSNYIFNANEMTVEQGYVVDKDGGKYGGRFTGRSVSNIYYACWMPKPTYVSDIVVESKMNNYIDFSNSMDAQYNSQPVYNAMINGATNIKTTYTDKIDDAITDIKIMVTPSGSGKPATTYVENDITYNLLSFNVKNDYKDWNVFKKYDINDLEKKEYEVVGDNYTYDKMYEQESITSDINYVPKYKYTYFDPLLIKEDLYEYGKVEAGDFIPRVMDDRGLAFMLRFHVDGDGEKEFYGKEFKIEDKLTVIFYPNTAPYPYGYEKYCDGVGYRDDGNKGRTIGIYSWSGWLYLWEYDNSLAIRILKALYMNYFEYDFEKLYAKMANCPSVEEKDYGSDFNNRYYKDIHILEKFEDLYEDKDYKLPERKYKLIGGTGDYYMSSLIYDKPMLLFATKKDYTEFDEDTVFYNMLLDGEPLSYGRKNGQAYLSSYFATVSNIDSDIKRHLTVLFTNVVENHKPEKSVYIYYTKDRMAGEPITKFELSKETTNNTSIYDGLVNLVWNGTNDTRYSKTGGNYQNGTRVDLKALGVNTDYRFPSIKRISIDRTSTFEVTFLPGDDYVESFEETTEGMEYVTNIRAIYNNQSNLNSSINDNTTSYKFNDSVTIDIVKSDNINDAITDIKLVKREIGKPITDDEFAIGDVRYYPVKLGIYTWSSYISVALEDNKDLNIADGGYKKSVVLGQALGSIRYSQGSSVKIDNRSVKVLNNEGKTVTYFIGDKYNGSYITGFYHYYDKDEGYVISADVQKDKKDCKLYMYYTKDRKAGDPITDFDFSDKLSDLTNDRIGIVNMTWEDSVSKEKTQSDQKVIDLNEIGINKKCRYPGIERRTTRTICKFVKGDTKVKTDGVIGKYQLYKGMDLNIYNRYKRDGYVFDYFLSSDGKTRYYNFTEQNAKEKNKNISIDHSDTLTAVWCKSGTVWFDDGSVNSSYKKVIEKIGRVSLPPETTGYMEKKVLKTNGESVTLSYNNYTASENGDTKRYEFRNWVLIHNNKVVRTYKDGDEIALPVVLDDYTELTDFTLVATWFRRVKISYDWNLPDDMKNNTIGDVPTTEWIRSGSYIELPGNPYETKNYELKGWNSSGTKEEVKYGIAKEQEIEFTLWGGMRQATKYKYLYHEDYKKEEDINKLLTNIKQDTNYHAVWKKKVTIEYDGYNYSDGYTKGKTLYVGDKYTLKDNGFRKTHGEFRCWADIYGIVYYPGEEIEALPFYEKKEGKYKIVSDTITFRAVWNIEYIVDISMSDSKKELEKAGYEVLGFSGGGVNIGIKREYIEENSEEGTAISNIAGVFYVPHTSTLVPNSWEDVMEPDNSDHFYFDIPTDDKKKYKNDQTRLRYFYQKNGQGIVDIDQIFERNIPLNASIIKYYVNQLNISFINCPSFESQVEWQGRFLGKNPFTEQSYNLAYPYQRMFRSNVDPNWKKTITIGDYKSIKKVDGEWEFDIEWNYDGGYWDPSESGTSISNRILKLPDSYVEGEGISSDIVLLSEKCVKKEGYKFLGWKDESTGRIVVEIDKTAKGKKKFIAQYNESPNYLTENWLAELFRKARLFQHYDDIDYKSIVQRIKFTNDSSEFNEMSLNYIVGYYYRYGEMTLNGLYEISARFFKDMSDNEYKLMIYIPEEKCPVCVRGNGSFFDGFTNLKSIEGLELLNFGFATDMSYMFRGCSSLETLDLSKFDTRSATNMNCMFSDCQSLTALDLSKFDTGKVKNMSFMFNNCKSLASLNLSDFNMSNVESTRGMFQNCRSLTTLDLSKFNTSKVTNMSFMFYGCELLTTLDLSKFDTNNVKATNGMFEDCRSLITVNLSSFDTSEVTDMSKMFSGCSTLKTLDLSKFDTVKVTNMESMFMNCKLLETLDLSRFDTKNVTNMKSMFEACWAFTALDLSDLDTRKVTSMESMFKGCLSLITLNLASFNTSNVVNMSSMFYSCFSLKALDLSNFNTSSVTNMKSMFESCSSLTTVDLSSFGTSEVENMEGMFRSCSSLTTLDLSKFNTSKVTNMAYMFFNCWLLNTLDLLNFETSNVTDMDYMFGGCSNLEELDLSKFDTSNVTRMIAMFKNCSSLTTLNLSNFDTNNVTNMDSIFTGCPFDLSTFDIEWELNGGYWNTEDREIPSDFATNYKYGVGIPTNEKEFASAGTYVKCKESVFVGWLDVNTGKIAKEISKTSIGNKKYIAQYKEIPKLTSKCWIQLLDGGLGNKINRSIINKIMFLHNNTSWDNYGLSNKIPSGCLAIDGFDYITSYMLSDNELAIWIAEEVEDVVYVKDANSFFACFTNVKSIEGLEYLNFEFVTDMSYMFNCCASLETLDLSKFDTKNVTNMNCMFNDCQSLTALDLSKFDTRKVKNTSLMFNNCKSLTLLNLSDFNMSNVETMSGMFQDCKLLTTLDLSDFDTRGVTNMCSMFSGCSSLETLVLSNFDTSNVVSMDSMFAYCYSLATVDLSKFDTSEVTDMSNMFGGCYSLETLDLLKFNTGNVTNMKFMFNDCSSLETLDLSKFDTRKVTNMSSMFMSCSSLVEIDLSNFDTSSVTNMGDMFRGCSSLETLDLSNFNTSNVKSMECMFMSCSSLEELDLSKFDTSSVTKMVAMFKDCSSFTTLDLSYFDTSNVTNITYMFYNCSNLRTIYCLNDFNQNVSSKNMFFTGCSCLIGGNNTQFNSSNTDISFAKVDREGVPGYFTNSKQVTAANINGNGGLYESGVGRTQYNPTNNGTGGASANRAGVSYYTIN